MKTYEKYVKVHEIWWKSIIWKFHEISNAVLVKKKYINEKSVKNKKVTFLFSKRYRWSNLRLHTDSTCTKRYFSEVGPLYFNLYVLILTFMFTVNFFFSWSMKIFYTTVKFREKILCVLFDFLPRSLTGNSIYRQCHCKTDLIFCCFLKW